MLYVFSRKVFHFLTDCQCFLSFNYLVSFLDNRPGFLRQGGIFYKQAGKQLPLLFKNTGLSKMNQTFVYCLTINIVIIFITTKFSGTSFIIFLSYTVYSNYRAKL